MRGRDFPNTRAFDEDDGCRLSGRTDVLPGKKHARQDRSVAELPDGGIL